MPTYIYKALSVDGRELTREATAPNEIELRRELEDRGVLVRGVRLKRGIFFSLLGQSVKPSDLLQANQEMITLLKAGLTVPEALDLAADRPESPFFSAILRRILEDVKTGDTLSSACAKYPHVFDGLYLASLKTGERTGNLAMPLARYQDYLRQRVALSNKVSQAMVYPAFLVVVLGMVLGLLFTFVMPRFAALYADFNAALPLPTQILMEVVHHLPVIVILLGSALLGAWGILKGWAATEAGAFQRDQALRRLPLVKDFVNPFLAAQLARTLSTLLSGGTPLTQALKVAREFQSNKSFAQQLDRVIRRVMEGEALSKAIEAEKLLSRTAVKLTQVGEASGQLEAMFQETADAYERLLEARLQRSMALVEPIFILLTGLLIGTVIVVMYLPIIHLSDVVK